MTRKIENEMVQSIVNDESFKKDNTKVINNKTYFDIYLHGHKIAVYYPNSMKLHVNNCGYATRTTKSRLNALIKFVDGGLSGIYQKRGQWYLKTTSQNNVEMNDNTWLTV
jgi:hypothetical protein|tara:strand:- start:286 stop:615 length:330 start_codon:yes stop_codon:yes gene_type:complete